MEMGQNSGRGVREMPQEFLPIFPEGEGDINGLLSFEKRDGQVYYFHGGFPVFSHAERDKQSFRLFVSQLVVNGSCKQVDIVRAFGISSISMKRYVKKYREGGAGAFFKEPKRRANPVLTTKVVAEAQGMLNEGRCWQEVADELGIKRNTFSKALRSGRLVEGEKKRGSREYEERAEHRG